MEISGNDANFSGDTSSTSLIYFPRRFLVNVGVVKAKHGNGRSHHIHWIGSFWRRLDEIDHWIWQLPFGSQRAREFVELASIWQFPLPQQVNDFLVADFAGEIVDVVAGVNELTLSADDIAQSRRIRDDAFQSAGDIRRLWRWRGFSLAQFGHGHLSEPNSALHSRNECVRHGCWRFGDGNTGGLEGLDFSRSCSFATRDNGAGMAHPASRRRGHACDESGDRFPAIISDPGCRFFFGGAADFADQNHRVGSRIIVKNFDGIKMRHAIDRISPNSDTG